MKPFLPVLTVAVVIGLTKGQCQDNEFTCLDGNCIPKRFKCDGNIDCQDRSDEKCKPDSCGKQGALKVNDDCYFRGLTADYSEAASHCRERHGANLAEPDTKGKCEELREMFDNYGPRRGVWIGIHDKGTEGRKLYWESSQLEVNLDDTEADCFKEDYLNNYDISLFTPDMKKKSCLVYNSIDGFKLYPCCKECIQSFQSFCVVELECSPDHIKCSSNISSDYCITKTMICDRYQDCEDGSDEANCYTATTLTSTDAEGKYINLWLIPAIIIIPITVLLIGVYCIKSSKFKKKMKKKKKQQPDSSAREETSTVADYSRGKSGVVILEREFKRLRRKEKRKMIEKKRQEKENSSDKGSDTDPDKQSEHSSTFLSDLGSTVTSETEKSFKSAASSSAKTQASYA